MDELNGIEKILHRFFYRSKRNQKKNAGQLGLKLYAVRITPCVSATVIQKI